MTVAANDEFEVTVTITVTDKKTGEKKTETAHTDYGLNYAGMLNMRHAAITGVAEKGLALGEELAAAMGQTIEKIAETGTTDAGTFQPAPGAIR